MPKSVVPTKHRLTLTQLSSYDDILTDALVDHVYFWTTIRKNKNLYHPSRGITEEAVTNILQKHVIVEHDPAKAAAEVLALPGIKKFHDALRTESERKDFREHLRRYTNIYSTDCSWEVSTTNRYTVVTQEAAVVARRDIKRGETIKYLCGVQVQLSEAEEENIKSSKRDFSIVVSSRSKTASLFLGPARFANHDCDANARLKTTGNNGMEIVAYRNINERDEITVSYGENYFGEDNCECLCRTCERHCRNGWTRNEDEPQTSIESETTPSDTYSFRQRRRRESLSRSPSMTPDVMIRPQIVKRTPRSLRFQPAQSPLGKSFSADIDVKFETSPTPSKRKRENDESQASPSKRRTATKLREEISVQDNKDCEAAMVSDSSNATRPLSARLSPTPSSVDNHTSTDGTSVEGDDTLTIGAIPAPDADQKKTKTLEQADAGEAILVGGSTTSQHPVISVQTDLDSLNVPKDGEPEVDVTDKSRQRSQGHKKKSVAPVSDKDHAPSVRYPGDYVYTHALLSEPAMSWINCKQCEEPFVQKDAYFTKSACPRCERHSKLYGYLWPKTDPEDSDDDEERVLDHRTVHRFIYPTEEKLSRKLARVSSLSGSQSLTREETENVLAPVVANGSPRPKGQEKSTSKVKVSPEVKRKKSTTKLATADKKEDSPHKRPKRRASDAKSPPQRRGIGRPRKSEGADTGIQTDTVVVKSKRRASEGKR